MKKYLKIIIFIISLFFTFINVNAEDIDLIVSPIKYEIKANPGDIITKKANIYNKNENTAYITSFSANFFSNDTSGAPSFSKDGSIPDKNTELASWITIDKSSFSLESGKTQIIDFTIKVPENATPGGHYGAIFFKYDGTKSKGLNIDADYGVLLLVNVSGEIIDNSTQGEIDIKPGSPGNIGDIKDDENVYIKKDNCKIDLTKSDTDGKCIDTDEIKDYVKEIKENIISKNNQKNNIRNNNGEEEEKTIIKEINFEIPFENKGNTHIKPKGKIILKNEKGEILKAVSKEEIKDKNNNVIGEKIVDYIPINPGDGNVLPNSKRIFKTTWKGFSELDRNKSGEVIIKTKNASDYFTNLYSTKRDELYPWERICEKLENKKITAYIYTNYKNYKGENIEFNSTKELNVEFKKKYIGLNPYFFILLGIGFIILWLFWFIIFGKIKKKCKNCKKKIKKDMKICPYCEKKQ